MPMIDAAGNHGLLRLAGAVGVDDLELQAVLLEDAGALADFGDRSVPVAALADRQLDLVVAPKRRWPVPNSMSAASASYGLMFSSSIPPCVLSSYFAGLRCLATRSSGASLPPPRLRQFVVLGTTPS